MDDNRISREKIPETDNGDGNGDSTKSSDRGSAAAASSSSSSSVPNSGGTRTKLLRGDDGGFSLLGIVFGLGLAGVLGVWMSDYCG